MIGRHTRLSSAYRQKTETILIDGLRIRMCVCLTLLSLINYTATTKLISLSLFFILISRRRSVLKTAAPRISQQLGFTAPRLS